MSDFIVTFGQQYKHTSHPRAPYAHPDGFLIVEAETLMEAREKAFAELGDKWSFIYPDSQETRSYFPLGELHRI